MIRSGARGPLGAPLTGGVGLLGVFFLTYALSFDIEGNTALNSSFHSPKDYPRETDLSGKSRRPSAVEP